MQGIANQLPYVFTNSKRLAANTSTQIEVLEGKLINVAANESKAHLKRGRPQEEKNKS